MITTFYLFGTHDLHAAELLASDADSTSEVLNLFLYIIGSAYVYIHAHRCETATVLFQL